MPDTTTSTATSTTCRLVRDTGSLPGTFPGLTVIVGRPSSGKSTLLGQILQQARTNGQDTEMYRLGTRHLHGRHEFAHPGVMLALTLRSPALIAVDDALLANPNAPADRSHAQVFKDLTTLGHSVVITTFQFRDLDLDAPAQNTVRQFADRYLILDPPSNSQLGTRDPYRPALLAGTTWKWREEYLDWQPSVDVATIRPLNTTPNEMTGT